MSRIDTRAHNAKAVKKLSEKDIEAAKKALQATNWMSQRRASGTAKILEELRPEIEEARRQGSSWPAIAAQLNMHLGTRLNPASLRVQFGSKKDQLTEKEKQTLEAQGVTVGAATPAADAPTQD